MNIQIRISIDVTPCSDAQIATAIENILEAVKREFPELHKAQMSSPVVVTIKQSEPTL